jgi:acetylornithine deacetylase
MIVVEPNQEVVLTLAHTGILFFRVRVLGRPAHAGLSHLGVNAIGKLNRIYDELMDLDQARATRVHDPIFERDHPRSCHLNIGTYRAGDSSTTVAGWAEIECRMSYIPDEDPEGVKSQVEQAIDRVVQHDDWLASHPPEITWMKRGAIAWKQDPQHPFAEMLKSVMGQVMGTKVEVVGVPWGMDSRFAGLFNIAAATIGPTGRNFHGIDEYVELDSVVNCAKVLAMFTSRWCGTYDDQRGSLRT